MKRKIERHLLKIWSRCLFYFLNSQKKKRKKEKTEETLWKKQKSLA